MENFIREYQIDTNLCDQLIRFFHRNPEHQYEGQSTSGVNKNIKDSIDLILHPSSDIFRDYIKEIKECFEKYSDEFPFITTTSSPWGITEGVNVQWYKPEGGYYTWHCERGGCRDNNILANRFLVWITYLNDVPNAGTEFKYFPELNVEAVKGKTIIWPVDWPHAHRGRVSRTHNKYIATGWMGFLKNSNELIDPVQKSILEEYEQKNNDRQVDSQIGDYDWDSGQGDKPAEYIDENMGIEKGGLGEMESFESEEQPKYEWPYPEKTTNSDRFFSDTTEYK